MPTVSEILSGEFPELYRRMDEWRARLAEIEAEQSLFSRARPDGPRGAGERAVMAVGLTAWPPAIYSAPVPAVAVQSNAPATVALSGAGLREASSPVSPNAFAELEGLQDLLSAVLEVGPNDKVAVVGVPRPVEQVAPGEQAHCGGGPASFGSRIFASTGARGILTAGHAAPSVNSSAYDASSSLVGTVTNAVRCSSVGAGVATPDVATIELLSHVPDTSSSAPASAGGTGHSLLWDTITAYGAQTSGKAAAVVMTGVPFAGPNPTVGNFGEATLTAYAISAPGDSGAPAFNQRGELVGHVVAGNRGVNSLVQDITYQLNAFNARLR